MEPEQGLAPAEPRRPGPTRIVLATLVTIALLALSIGYHDGLFWTDELASATVPGGYRFKGVIAHYDPAEQTILLRDGADQRSLHWNITEPAVGRLYVVDAQIHEDGSLEALALSPVLVFRAG